MGKTKSRDYIRVEALTGDGDQWDEVVTIDKESGSPATFLRERGESKPPLRLEKTHINVKDSDPSPKVSLEVSPATISESGGTATVTASLDLRSVERTTIVVAPTPEANAGRERIRLHGNADAEDWRGRKTTSTDVVRVVAVNNDVDEPDATVYLTATAHNELGVKEPDNTPLVLRDDDTARVTLVLAPEVIAENGGRSAVTAALDVPSSAPITVTIAAAAVPPATDAAFTVSDGTVLTIPAGTTASAGTVTITAVNDAAAGQKRILVSGTATGGNDVQAPAARVLRVSDDESAPAVTLVLSSAAIAEDGGRATVTAALDHPALEPTAVTVTVTPVGAG